MTIANSLKSLNKIRTLPSGQLKVTPWDIQLIFGRILSLDEMKMLIENELAVYVSPQTAKSLLKVLTGVAQQYEDKIGEIKYGEREDPSQA